MDVGRLINLEAKLRKIDQYAERARVARKEIDSLRVLWQFFFRGVLKGELLPSLLKRMRSRGWAVELFMQGGDPIVKQWILESLPPERRDDPVYKAITSDFADESLAMFVQSEMRLSKVEIKSLLILTERKIRAFSAHSVTGSTLSIVLATGGLIIQVVPRELFVVLGIPTYYTTWRAVASMVLVVVIVYLAISLLRPLNASKKVVARYESAEWLLTYMDVTTADDDPGPPEDSLSEIRSTVDEK